METECAPKESKTIAPIASTIDLNQLADGNYHVSFSADQLQETADGYALTVDIYEYDRYWAEDILNLAPGDVLITCGRKLPVETVDLVINEENEDFYVEVNDIYPDDSEDWLLLICEEYDVDKIYHAERDSKRPLYQKVGTVTLPLNNTMEYADYVFDMENPQRGFGAEEFTQHLAECSIGEYWAIDTMLSLDQGEVVMIVRNWIP